MKPVGSFATNLTHPPDRAAGNMEDKELMGQAAPSAGERYDAFISYRRHDGRVLANWIRERLQAYRLPAEVLDRLSPEKRALHERRPHIYIDEAFEKPSNDFLQYKLYPALDAADRLVVVCTPSCFEPILDERGTEQPNWLVREIDRFLMVDGNRPIDIVIGPGAPERGFPGQLLEREHPDPVDLRRFRPWRWRLDASVGSGLTKLIAGLYDVPGQALPDLYREEARRKGRLVTQVLAGASVIILGVSTLGAFAWYQRAVAVAQRDLALTRESLLLAQLADQQIAAGDPVTGMLLALRALPRADPPERPFVEEAKQALVRGGWARREDLVLRGHEEWATSVAFSPDGRRLVSGSNDSTLRLWNAETGELIGEPLRLRG